MQLGGGSSQPSSSGRIPWTHHCWPLRSACCPEVRGWCRRWTATRPQPRGNPTRTGTAMIYNGRYPREHDDAVTRQTETKHSCRTFTRRTYHQRSARYCQNTTEARAMTQQDHSNTEVSFSESHLLAVLLCIGGVLRVALGRLLPCLINLLTGSEKILSSTIGVTTSARFKPSLLFTATLASA